MFLRHTSGLSELDFNQTLRWKASVFLWSGLSSPDPSDRRLQRCAELRSPCGQDSWRDAPRNHMPWNRGLLMLVPSIIIGWREGHLWLLELLFDVNLCPLCSGCRELRLPWKISSLEGTMQHKDPKLYQIGFVRCTERSWWEEWSFQR